MIIMYAVIKYENIKMYQPLQILHLFENLDDAREKAYKLAFEIYGDYIEDFSKIEKSYIVKKYNVETLFDYSDWCVDLSGKSDNLVFAVLEII